VENGSKIVLVRIWNEDGNAEQEIKRVMRSLVRLCPICNHRAGTRMKAYKSALVNVRSPKELEQVLLSVTNELRNC
jgi:hypothetical protein